MRYGFPGGRKGVSDLSSGKEYLILPKQLAGVIPESAIEHRIGVAKK